MRILVVEDDPGVRATVVRMLEFLGHGATAVASGEEAGDLPDGSAFDAILADLRLPDMPGHEVVDRMRRRWPRLKALIMSGDIDREELRAGAAAGRWWILAKPFDLEQLAAGLAGLSEPRA